jgi:hypothetical protein
MRMPFTQSWTPLFLYISCTRQWKDRFLLIDWMQNTQTRGVLFMRESWQAYNTCSTHRLTTLVLLIPEGIVECRTAVHPVHAFTSIGRDCVGCFIGTWKGECFGSSSRGQPLHQVTQRQVIKFADPTRRSGHTTCYTHCIGMCISSGIKASVSSVGLFLSLVG